MQNYKKMQVVDDSIKLKFQNINLSNNVSRKFVHKNLRQLRKIFNVLNGLL